MTEPTVTHRASDDRVEEHSSITIDRRIPLTWLIGGLVAVVGAFGGLFLQQLGTANKVDQSALKVDNVAVDVKQMRADMQLQGKQAMEDNFTLRELTRRMTAAEIKLESIQQQRQQGGKQ